VEGRKNDIGKCRLDLIPPDALWEVGKVYTMGATKYDDRNWEKGIQYGRVFAAMLRHAWKWFSGETYDTEDGQHHLASVIWCGLALLHYDLNKEKYKQYDNRPEGTVKVWLPKLHPEKEVVQPKSSQLLLPLHPEVQPPYREVNGFHSLGVRSVESTPSIR